MPPSAEDLDRLLIAGWPRQPPKGGLVTDSILIRRAIDALDLGVIVLSSNLKTVLFINVAATELLGDRLPESVTDAIAGYVNARRDERRLPPAIRALLGERTLFLHVVPSQGEPPMEVVTVREEIVRDVDVFRLLNARHGVSRREYQIITALRLGKTNRQISNELSISEGTVGRHVHRLLERFEVPNRTRLANLVEQLITRRA